MKLSRNALLPLTARCHCKNSSIILNSQPLLTYTCHCSMCRLTTGSLSQTFTVFRQPRPTPSEFMTVYESTPGQVERVFCSTCSCTIFSTMKSTPGLLYVASAAIENHPPSTVHNVFVADKLPNLSQQGESHEAWPEELFDFLNN